MKNRFNFFLKQLNSRGARLSLLILTLIILVPISGIVDAIIYDFGGDAERYRGDGDQTPPACTMEVPRAAKEPFFVTWTCSDNADTADNIRSELWIFRNGAPAGQLLANFLGFPASVFIDQGVLQVEDFSDGIPVHFRLVARDRAGVATVSPVFTVSSRDNSVDTCTLRVVTESTESTESTTGLPSMTVLLTDTPVTSQQLSTSSLRVFTLQAKVADPCEIDELCSNSGEISFDAAISLGQNNLAEATLMLSPSDLAVALNGTASVNGAVLQGLDLTGTGNIDGVPANFDLSCSQLS